MMQWRAQRMTISGCRVAAVAVAGVLLAGALPAFAGGGEGGEAPRKKLTVEVKASQIPERLEQDFGPVMAGDLLVLDIAIRNDTAAPLEIARVVPKCACMEAEFDQEVAPGGTGHITILLESDDYSGAVRESALVLWLDRAVAVTTVDVLTTVKPLVEVLPRRLVRFSVSSGESAAAEVEVRSPDGTPFRVTGVESSKPYLRARAEGEREGVSHRVVIELAGDAPPGMLRESITLATDLPGNPKVELKITGVVRKPKTE